MKIAVIVVRSLLGLMFLVFGLNVFFNFIPMKEQPVMPESAQQFSQALMTSGYMKAVAVCEVAGGLLLLLGRFVPLGLVLLGPVIVNILFFHGFLNPTGWQPGAVTALLEIFLLYAYRGAFAGIFQAKIDLANRGETLPL